jgi:hypothetical protein
MPTLSTLVSSIEDILQDPAYPPERLIDRINDALQHIAGGIRMPDGQTSPPLPDLYSYGVVNTSTTLPYVSLPADYQRKVSLVYLDGKYRINPPRGGDYYAFKLFTNQISNKGFAETGTIYRVAIKGKNIYYQGIPAVSTTIGVHYYKKPDILALDGDEPEGIPEHLAGGLIKHYVIMNIFGEAVEDGQDNTGIGNKYHAGKFYAYMTDLLDYIGIDGEPEYYGSGGFEDRGVCD